MLAHVRDLLARHRWIAPAFAFVGTFAAASWFWPTVSFTDGDSFYHIKMTELLAHGIVRNFPWLPFSSFAANYIDHHFLFHVVLLPFIHFLNPFVGMKLATALLASTVITIFYIVLRSLNVRAPGFFTALLVVSPHFFFRENLAKAPAFSLIFLLLGLLFLIKKKPIALGILAFLYVWAYDAWPLLGGIVVFWIAGRSLIAPALAPGKYSWHAAWNQLRAPEHLHLLIAVTVGTIAGTILNPYFPANVPFYWLHIVKIGFLNYQSKISVGAEWYPLGLGDIISTQPFLFIIGFLSTGLVLFHAHIINEHARRRHTHVTFLDHHAGTRRDELVTPEQLMTTFAMIVIAGIFLFVTLKSRRNVDYSIPFMMLAVASVWHVGADATAHVRDLIRKHMFGWARWFLVVVIIISSLALAANQATLLLAYRDQLATGYDPNHFTPATTWMREHIPANEIIFHTNWDTFPMLWYGDDSHRYIVGMDTTFLYDRDPVRYDQWSKITSGEYVGDVTKIIRDTFNSHYVFLDKHRDHDLFEKQLRLSHTATVVYDDSVGTIFKLVDVSIEK